MRDTPIGFVQHILAMDCETTGLCYNSHSPIYNSSDPSADRHQTVSWGLAVARFDTLEVVDKIYVEVKWNKNSIKQRENNPRFGADAEGVHRLSKEYLDENGVSEERAIELMTSMILKYWGPTSSIIALGHNVHTFDIPFFRDLYNRHDIPIKLGNRHIDTNSIGMVTTGKFNSDDFFESMGFALRDGHNALDDTLIALESARRVKVLWKSKVGL